MANNPKVLYPTKVGTVTAAFPYGPAQDISAPGDLTGTPWTAAILNDIFGFQQALLTAAAIVPSGTPDQVGASQYLESMAAINAYANVKVFGATGDGATDDTVAIQAAIDSVSNGGIVIPPGDYVVTQLDLASDKTLIGIGGELTLKANADSPAVEVPVGSTNVKIIGLKINGNAANNLGTAVGDGLLSINSSLGSPTTNVTVQGCTILDARRNNVSIQDGASGIKILDNVITTSTGGEGVDMCPSGGSVADILISGNSISASNLSLINGEGTVLNSRIVGNFLDTAGADGITLSDDSNESVTIAGNVIVSLAAMGINFGGDNIHVVNNTIKDPTTTGIQLLTGGSSPGVLAERCKIIGNTITGTTYVAGIFAENVKAVQIASNSMEGGSGVGISVKQNTTVDAADRCKICDNEVTSFAGYLVHIQGNIRAGIISGNTLVGTGAANGVEMGGSSAVVERFAVAGNTIDGTLTAYKEQTGCDKNQITGNNVMGWSVAGLDEVGTSNASSNTAAS